MCRAICWNCFDDEYLSMIAKSDGEPLECSVCECKNKNALTVAELGKLMAPIISEHFSRGNDVKVFHGEDDDNGSWEQEGEPLSSAVQSVLGQYFDFEDEIVDAVIEAEDVRPQDGDIPFFDKCNMYVESRVALSNYYAEWESLLYELKHQRRFFSPAAHALFADLFEDVDAMKAWVRGAKTPKSVVRTLPTGTELFRSRICNSQSLLNDIYADPFKHVGPPPQDSARAGRMNAEGVAVFYGATELDTCLAEMRPAIGNDLAVITVRTTTPLRVLDFSRLEQPHGAGALSYFQPNFTAELEKRAFRRRLHRLISQPIVPGKESDYLITQTMAEYLAHVHKTPFDGILFSSVQRANGTNVVLFADHSLLTDSTAEEFRVSYIDDSVGLFSIQSIKYKHRKRDVSLYDGVPFIHQSTDFDDEWLD